MRGAVFQSSHPHVVTFDPTASLLAPLNVHTGFGTQTFHFVNDSGASYTCIDTSVYRRLEPYLPSGSLEATKIKLVSANDDKRIGIHGEVYLKVDIDGSPTTTIRAVVANIGPDKCLLGGETLHQLGAVISYPDRSLYLTAFQNYQVPLRTEIGEYVAAVTLPAGCTVPPHSMVTIKARLREGAHHQPPKFRTFAPNVNYTDRSLRDTLIPYCLVPTRGGEVELTVTNTSDTTSYIPKGEGLGTINSAVSVDEGRALRPVKLLQRAPISVKRRFERYRSVHLFRSGPAGHWPKMSGN